MFVVSIKIGYSDFTCSRMSVEHLVIFTDFVEDTLKGHPGMERREAVEYVMNYIHNVCECPECVVKKEHDTAKMTQLIHDLCYGVAVQRTKEELARQGHYAECECKLCEERHDGV